MNWNLLPDWLLRLLPDVNDFHDFATVAGVVSGIVGCWAIWQNRRARRLNERLIEAQGLMEKPELDIEVFGSPDATLVVAAVPLDGERIVEFPWRWRFTNAGKKTAKDIEIFITTSRDLQYGGAAAGVAKYVQESTPIAKAVRGGFESVSDLLERQSVVVSSLNPGQSLVVSGVISVSRSTVFKSEVDVTFRDGKTARVAYQGRFAYTLDVAVSGVDQPIKEKHFSLEVLDTAKQSARVVLDERNRRAGKSAERSAKPVVDKKFERLLLIDVTREQLVPDANPQVPIDRVRAGARLNVYDGVALENGVTWLPSLGVVPGRSANAGRPTVVDLGDYQMP